MECQKCKDVIEHVCMGMSAFEVGNIKQALSEVSSAMGRVHCVRTALGNNEWVKADRIATEAYSELGNAIKHLQLVINTAENL